MEGPAKALFDEAYEAPDGEEEVTVLFHYLVRVAAKEDRAVMHASVARSTDWP